MSDSKDVWPPPISASNEPPPSPSEKPQAGIAALRCLLANAALTIAFFAFALAGFKTTNSNFAVVTGIWLVGELILVFAGIILGAIGLRSWQGKCGLIGSILSIGFFFILSFLYAFASA
ncbi:MAG: hypothetical protein JWQ02_2051 [Capsulimonas sp.]|nr:hypothetical protein [Capsulimonas sp.]